MIVEVGRGRGRITIEGAGIVFGRVVVGEVFGSGIDDAEKGW